MRSNLIALAFGLLLASTTHASGTAVRKVSHSGGDQHCNPKYEFIQVDAFPPVCASSPGKLDIFYRIGSYGSDAVYRWKLVNGTITGGQGTDTITIIAGAFGRVSVELDLDFTDCPDLVHIFGSTSIEPAPSASIPAVVETCSGSSVTVPMSLTGTPPFTVVWSDGVTQSNVNGTLTSRSVTASVSQNLSITEVSDASASACNPNSGPATFILVNTSPQFVSQSEDPRIDTAHSAHLSADVKGSDLRFQWYRGKVGDESSAVGTGLASFDTPQLRETTLYWLKAMSSCGSVQSRQFTVHVAVPRRRVAGS